jgi:hypothetical protein
MGKKGERHSMNYSEGDRSLQDISADRTTLIFPSHVAACRARKKEVNDRKDLSSSM